MPAPRHRDALWLAMAAAGFVLALLVALSGKKFP